MDDRQSESRHAVTAEVLNFGIDRILNNESETGKYNIYFELLYYIIYT